LTAGTGISLSGSTGNVTVSTTAGTASYALNAYTSPATWTKPAGLSSIKVTVVGAGGNGGAVSTNTVPVTGAGGGGGGAAIYYAPAASIPGPVAITAGAGTNSFGAIASATAGGNSPTNTGFDYAGAAGGSGSGGNLNIQGSDGAPNGATYGGSSILGPVSAWTPSSGPSTPGGAGRAYGGGGAGAFKLGTPAPQTFPGGTGAPGVVIVEEFY
jgi:hypothetical protein